jgi:hypothetical protein
MPLEQIAPREPLPRHRWFCNGCTFTTDYTREAEDHALENTVPFPHFLYERERLEGKPQARIHSEPGSSPSVPVVVRMMVRSRG